MILHRTPTGSSCLMVWKASVRRPNCTLVLTMELTLSGEGTDTLND